MSLEPDTLNMSNGILSCVALIQLFNLSYVSMFRLWDVETEKADTQWSEIVTIRNSL